MLLKNIKIKTREEVEIKNIKRLLELMGKYFEHSRVLTIAEWTELNVLLEAAKNFNKMYCVRCDSLSLFQSGLCIDHFLKNTKYFLELITFIEKQEMAH